VNELSGEAIIIQAEDGTITSWNPGAERLSGYSAAEALGQPMALVVDPDRTSMPPHFRDQLERTQGFEQMRTVLVRKDGTSVPVSMSVAPLGDGAGHITGAITLARPVP
jgi:PAS domain S-box-containing protein